MKKMIKFIIILGCIILGIALIINFMILLKGKKKIISEKQASQLANVDCILVLGAGIRNGKPTHMLEDRLLQGIALYQNKASEKIIMSGDHGKENYDEVNIMKQFAIDKGVPSTDIFMDHAGFSTYESIYRAKEIFAANRILIVTQEYHLYRALHIAERLGVEAYGVASDPREYIGQLMREIREVIARNKDFFICFIKPEPTYLGETIPVSGDGDITNDKQDQSDAGKEN